jgi:hypothetical protein
MHFWIRFVIFLTILQENCYSCTETLFCFTASQLRLTLPSLFQNKAYISSGNSFVLVGEKGVMISLLFWPLC